MALVEYSDSESDNEAAPALISPSAVAKAQPTTNTTIQQGGAPGKIKVDLPTFRPEAGQEAHGTDGPPVKRARVAGAFSGFNSLLPAPKRTAQNAPKAGVSLKTSSEAAFSRTPATGGHDETYIAPGVPNTMPVHNSSEALAEPKLVGKTTRFLPLSVSGKKKKKPISKPLAATHAKESGEDGMRSAVASQEDVAQPAEPLKAKPKKSLFSLSQEKEEEEGEELAAPGAGTAAYEPITIPRVQAQTELSIEEAAAIYHDDVDTTPANPNSLERVAAEMNLTAAQRRQLFGRQQGKEARVTHFDLDAQYNENERMRQAGEVVEHRAVKAIASGKHSLTQLVNNARSQQDALEDKWADGRKKRGEGGSKYGWST